MTRAQHGFFWYTGKGALFLLKGVLRVMRVLLAVLLILGLAGFFGARWLFHEERVRAVLVTQLQELLRRPVQIGGVVLTPSGVKLRDIRVIERLDVPGQFLLTSDTAVVTLRLAPLLRRRVELDSVKLLNPRVRLLRDADGRWSVADIFVSSGAERRVEMGRLSLPVSLAAHTILLDEGSIDIEDRFKSTSYRFDRVHLEVSDFSLEDPFGFRASFDNANVVSSRTISTAWKIDGEASLASFDLKAAYLRADRVTASVDGRALRGKGTVTGFTESSVELEASVPALGPADWEHFLGRPLALELPASKWKAQLRFPSPREIDFRRVEVQASPMSAVASALLDLSPEKRTLTAAVSAENIPLDKAAGLRPSWARFALQGAASGKATVAGPLSRLQVKDASVRLSGLGGYFGPARVVAADGELAIADDFSRIKLNAQKGAIDAYGAFFREIALQLDLVKSDLRVENLSFRVGESAFKLKARVRNITDPKEVAVSGTVDQVRWEEAQSIVTAVLSSTRTRRAEGAKPQEWVRIFKYVIPKKFPDSVGEVTIGQVTHKNFHFANMDLLWDIRGVTPSLDRVTGDVKIGFGPGRVNDIPAVQDSHKFLRIVFLPFVYMHKMNNLSVFSAATAYPKTLDFNRIEGEYHAESGVAETRCFYVDSPQMVAYAEGKADFARERVDMNILTRLTTYRDPLPEWWVDTAGRPAIGFRVKNDLNRPDLDPRLRKMEGDEIETNVAACKAQSRMKHGALEKIRRL